MLPWWWVLPLPWWWVLPWWSVLPWWWMRSDSGLVLQEETHGSGALQTLRCLNLSNQGLTAMPLGQSATQLSRRFRHFDCETASGCARSQVARAAAYPVHHWQRCNCIEQSCLVVTANRGAAIEHAACGEHPPDAAAVLVGSVLPGLDVTTDLQRLAKGAIEYRIVSCIQNCIH